MTSICSITIKIGMEGKGLEPTVEALFGENGFFPDTTLRTMYFISDNMPSGFGQILKNMLPTLRNDRKKREVFNDTFCLFFF